MLGFVQNWFAPRANPIGVDFGSDCLRMAQVQFVGNEYRLVAAASADVPPHIKGDVAARMAFFVETTRDLLAQGNFRSRQAILALPAAEMHIQHLRIAKMNEEETKKALPWEARGKIPIDPSKALLRHITAGEVYQDQEPKNEVIVMAGGREFVQQLLNSAAKARLDVVGMNVEPKAVVDCFEHVYRRKADQTSINCFLDIGWFGSRVVIAQGPDVRFARTIPVGGETFAKATAHALRISLGESKLLRFKIAMAPAPEPQTEAPAAATQIATAPPSTDNSFALLGAGMQAAERQMQPEAQLQPPPAPAPAVPSDDPRSEQARQVEQACREPLSKLVEELDLCRRYYEATFPNKPVDRLIFVGGEARQRALCQHIARELGLAAQVGDPMVRMGRVSEIGPETGIDRRHPQPAWAVAIGLSLGPAAIEQPQAAAAKAS
jgi:type IV pilus assembly protein PilM